MLRFVHVPALALLLVACGGSAKPASTEKSEADPSSGSTPEKAEKQDAENKEAAPAEGEKAEAEGGKIPTACSGKGDMCTPTEDFVKRLCQDVYPGVAMIMFRKGTPWARMYLTGKTQAWNASGGASVSGFLEFDEEVLVLRHRAAPKGGMQVSGAGGGYDALRLDGSCVTLDGGEVTEKRPPKPKYPHLEWRWIDDPIREKLKEDPKIDETDQIRRKECKGATMGEVSDKCEKAVKKLSDLVAKYVTEDGGEIPMPQKLP